MKKKRTRFQIWASLQPRGTKARVMRESGCSPSTLGHLLHGIPVRQVDAAERISRATGGAVTVAEIMGVR